MIPRYFDVHSHLTCKDYDQDLLEVLRRMEEEKVWTITVGVDKKTSEEAVRFSEGRSNFFSIVGLHPTDTAAETFAENEYKVFTEHPKMVGIGECGLDYYRLDILGGQAKASVGRSPDALLGKAFGEKKRQYREFEKQMEFAIKYDKPLMIHCRPTKGTVDAYLDILAVLEHRHREVGEKLRGNVHFFVGDVDVARRFYTIGFSTSFTGVLTFTHDYDEVVSFAPLNMLLTETDSPFATPQPFRGRRNEPSYVKHVVQAIGEIRGISEEEAREASVQNALRVFAIPT